MMCKRRSGFTLIELLVVIAIIAILAAMLFPVFARARESARKIQCLANVKNIATAIQMYLTDYDRLMPTEHGQAAIQYFDGAPGGGSWDPDTLPHCNRGYQANPYLQWPVILDEYVKNRDVWRCPSARYVSSGANWIVPDYGRGSLRYLMDTEGQWGRNGCDGGGPCGIAWPSGWGGTVTDSIKQQMCASSDTNHFEATVGYARYPELKTSQVGDAAWFVVCGDSTLWPNIVGITTMLYELCGLGCGPADWTNCPDESGNCLDSHDYDRWQTDSSFRSRYTRHLGGSNFGFMDGHASWMLADAAVALAPYCLDDCTCSHIITDGRPLRGICPDKGRQ
jgi:prepilin-type N-terminal cleavage/methylation domain-containing protein/prepilin-type processing-associated H-X9-DG protein